MTLHANLLLYSYPSPFILGLFRNETGDGAIVLTYDCPSLTDELSTEGRRICFLK